MNKDGPIKATMDELRMKFAKFIELRLEEPSEEGGKFALICKFIAPTKISARHEVRRKIEESLRKQNEVHSVVRSKAPEELRYNFSVGV